MQIKNITIGFLIFCNTIIYAQEAPTLRVAYQSYFPIGAAVNPSIIASSDEPLLSEQFNSITADNCMKPEVIHPSEGVYNWTLADSLVNYAQRKGMKMRGHVLVWHEQTPDWFFKDGDKPASKELLLSRMREHIRAVVGRYKGKIYCWDVVNEAVDDDSTRIFREKKSKWYFICKEEFIAKAFEYAHEADPNAILFYNDYNTERPEKRERVYQMIKMLKDKGVPIDGVGLQAHWSIFEPSENELRTAIDRFSSLGLQIQFTELDISVYKWEKEPRKPFASEVFILTAEQERLQTEKYEMVFRIFREYKYVVTGITFWGLADNKTWLDFYPVAGRKNYPFLFDVNLKPKPAFFKVVNF